MNKKGFTLVELLAVIAILGVIIIIAVTSVTSIMKKSKMNAFKNDATVLSDAALTKYSDDKLLKNYSEDLYNGSVSGKRCYSIQNSLKGKYAKVNNSSLVGSVEVCYDDTCKTKIWISNGTYNINGTEYDAIKDNSEDTLKTTTFNNKYNKCGKN